VSYYLIGDEVDEKQIEQWQIDANAGDERAQLLLGQHYLKLAEFDKDPQPTAKLAVSFLIKSSKQGSDDATKLLADCLKKELGWHVYIYVMFHFLFHTGGGDATPGRFKLR